MNIPQKPTDPEARSTGNANPLPSEDRVVRFEELAEREREVVIEFRGQRYRLRATRNGGLVLNK